LNLNSGQLIANTSTTQPAFIIGGGLSGQAYSNTNCWYSDNLGYNAGFYYLSSGQGDLIHFASGDIILQTAANGTGGTSASPTTALHIFNGLDVGINNDLDFTGLGALQSTSTTQPQFGLFYSGTIYANMRVVSSGALDFTGPITALNFPNTALPYNGSADSVVETQTTAGVATMGRVPAGQIKYLHTIFAPTTGGTVALVNRQYNIINPSGALLALTVNLPSSPSNNDVVYIKYTQAITTVTYGNGTVVDGITSPIAGGLVVLTYDSGTTSWY
jgi:hypothetical protein